MKIESVSISQYRSCTSTELSFNKNLTALIGINGAGKSNLLTALLLLQEVDKGLRYKEFSGIRHGLKQLINNSSIKVVLSYRKKKVKIEGKFYYETDERNIDDVQNAIVKWDFSEFIKGMGLMNIPLELLNIRRLGFTKPHEFGVLSGINKHLQEDYSSLFKLSLDNIKFLEKSFENISEYFKSITYYSASQFADPSKCPVYIEMEENRPRRVYRNGGESHAKFILDLYKAWKAESKGFKRYLSIVSQHTLGLIDSIDFKEVEMPSPSYVVRIGGKVQKTNKNRVLIIPGFTVSGNSLSPNQLSEGTLKTLALLFYIMTDRSSLLLIEEPEVGIHHGLLTSVIELIKEQSKSKQIVISTHSEFVIDQLKPENVLLVTRKARKGTKVETLSEKLSQNDYKVLKEYLKDSGNLGEYLFETGLSLN